MYLTTLQISQPINLLFIISLVMAVTLFLTDRRTLLLGSSLMISTGCLFYYLNWYAFLYNSFNILMLLTLLQLHLGGSYLFKHYCNKLSWLIYLFAIVIGGVALFVSILYLRHCPLVAYGHWLMLSSLRAFTFVNISYLVSLTINLIFKPSNHIQYIIVLGAGLKKDKVTPLLAQRIQVAIRHYHKHPGSKLILSGGQGEDEWVAEAIAMRDYAVQHGVAEDDTLIEAQSTNTEGNLALSWAIINDQSGDSPNILIATSYYHTLRALLTARKLGLSAKAVGAPSSKSFYFLAYAYCRELMAYLLNHRMLSLTISILVLVLAHFHLT